MTEPNKETCRWPQCNNPIVGESSTGIESFDDIGSCYCLRHCSKAIAIRLAKASSITLANPATGELREIRVVPLAIKYLNDGWQIHEYRLDQQYDIEHREVL